MLTLEYVIDESCLSCSKEACYDLQGGGEERVSAQASLPSAAHQATAGHTVIGILGSAADGAILECFF